MPLIQKKSLNGYITPLMLSGSVALRRRKVSNNGTRRITGPVDQALAELGLERNIAAVVPSFPAALAVAQASDLVALVPASFLINQPVVNGNGVVATLFAFELPVKTQGITVSQMWHPRSEVDPAHRWLRQLVLSVCRRQAPTS
ncbi:HTH-type transcriptional regulator SyrM 1 [Serratia inhibens PRI-2C]|nr:HTH-type transcriptional regulator SyrM 1 [Serratia inhibens PRI-2C]